jgi:hypothetical protein
VTSKTDPAFPGLFEKLWAGLADVVEGQESAEVAV